MKRKDDPRHKARVIAVKKLFERSFLNTQSGQSQLAAKVLKKQQEIDKFITKNAPAWPLEQISPVDLATLRLAIWELVYSSKKEPYKVIIDEAVEIAKEYGGESSAGFVNGVLGTIIKSRKILKK